MNKATFVRHVEGWAGDARLYKLDVPVNYYSTVAGTHGVTNHVIVSGITNTIFNSGPETYIFPATEEGEPKDTAHLSEGSFKGSVDHAKALLGAGYEIVE